MADKLVTNREVGGKLLANPHGMTTPSSAERLSSSDQISFDAGRVLAAFLLLHIIVWVALPVIFTRGLPVDVIEGVIWGQGWQLSYLHPPFQAWLLGAADWLAGYQRWVIYLLSQLLVATCVENAARRPSGPSSKTRHPTTVPRRST
jgi:hypothetical protein